jgi:DNA invertase Pin-like site-specific DNA recombinase
MATKRTAPPGSPKRVVGYLRVSTDDQALGPAAQRAALEQWCEANGAELVAAFDDLGVSGGAPLDRRPELVAALDALRPLGAGVLLVAKRDRLARDVMTAGYIEASAAKHGARVVSAAGEGEGDEPAAKLMRTIVDAFAAYELQVIRARTRAALEVKCARGQRTGSVPFGKRLGPDGRTLEADPAEGAVVARVRALRAEGVSLRGIVAFLEREGVTGRTGAPLAVNQVFAICRPGRRRERAA